MIMNGKMNGLIVQHVTVENFGKDYTNEMDNPFQNVLS